ncbi:MAG: hypothetical protein U0R71_03735 [Solirubrobacterales bacterium]
MATDPASALDVLAFAAIKISPNSNGLPGFSTAERLLGGGAKYVLLACFAGGLWGVGQWVLGTRHGHGEGASAGKVKIGIACAGVFLVGALPALLNFFEGIGKTVK